MSIYDYMKQDNRGRKVLICDDLPAKGFIDAIKVQDICKMRIIGRKERAKIKLEPGSPDVIITSLTGERQQITREQLCRNYVCTNNKPIILAFVRDSKEYVVKSKQNSNQTYKILKLPDKCPAILRNKQIEPGSYIVCTSDEQGKADVSNMRAISAKTFRRTFKIPMQPVIEKALGIGKISRQINLLKDITSEDRAYSILSNNSKDTNMHNIDAVNSKIDEEDNRFNRQIQNSNTIKNNTEQSKYRFRAINKIVDNDNKTIGFTIQEIATNKVKQLTLVQVYKLCNQKTVSNLILVKNENTGQSYLKGNGMRLENLPKVLR